MTTAQVLPPRPAFREYSDSIAFADAKLVEPKRDMAHSFGEPLAGYAGPLRHKDSRLHQGGERIMLVTFVNH